MATEAKVAGRPATSRGSPARRRRGRAWLEWLSVPVIAIAVWSLLAGVLRPGLVASPVETVQAIVEGAARGWLGLHLVETLTATVYAFALACVVGCIIGFAIGLVRFWHAVLEPVVMSLYAVPKVVLFPIFLFIFGLGMNAKAFFAMAFGVFPIIVFTMDGTRNVNPVLIKAGRSLGLPHWRIIRYIILPAIVPSVMAGLRIGLGVTFLGVIMAEMFSAHQGLGFMLMQALSLHILPRIYGLVLLMSVLALAANSLFLATEVTIARRRGQR